MARTPVSDLMRENQQALLGALGAGGGVATAGEAIRQYIIKRTDLGRDVRLQRFTPYAASTRKKKRKKGQRLQPVSLRDTEEMLESMEVQPVQRSWGTEVIESVIQFRGKRNSDLARIHSEPDTPRTKIPLREFFGMDEQDPAAQAMAEQFGISLGRKLHRDRRRTVSLTIFRARKGLF